MVAAEPVAEEGLALGEVERVAVVVGVVERAMA